MRRGLSPGSRLALALAAALIAAGLAWLPQGADLDRRAYDSLFVLRGPQPPPPGVVVVAIDEPSFAALGLPWPWPRSLHALLLERLFSDGARAVALDLILDSPSRPAEDAALAKALGRYRRVVLAAAREVSETSAVKVETLLGPSPAVLPEPHPAGPVVGLVNLPMDPDGYLRHLAWPGEDRGGITPLSLAAARLAATGLDQERLEGLAREGGALNIDFAGRRGRVTTVSYYQALLPDHLPAGFFKDKLVLVGLVSAAVAEGASRPADAFPVPFTRWGGGYLPGVEAHANAADSFLRQRGIGLVPRPWVSLAGLFLGLGAGLVFLKLTPVRGGLLALAAALAVAALCYGLFVAERLFLCPTPLLLPLGLAWLMSPFVHYGQAWRERNFIRRTFGRYISPQVVSQVLDSPQGLNLGGERMTVTILMADLRGFTRRSEESDPEEMVAVLNRHLTAMAEVILAHEGLIDEFIGDAILAVFGAPVAHDDDPARAVACALAMQVRLAGLNQELLAEGLTPLEMGIGINTGAVVVGNIGSPQRMKYGLVGAAINQAARIESNTVGGQVLIGGPTHAAVRDLVTVLSSGEVAMKGLKEPLQVYEIGAIGPPYDVALPQATEETWGALELPLTARVVAKDKTIAAEAIPGRTLELSPRHWLVALERPLAPLTDLELNLDPPPGQPPLGEVYAKVIAAADGAGRLRLRLTSLNQADAKRLAEMARGH